MTDLWCDEVCGVAGGHEEPVLCAELLGEAEVDDAERVGVAAGVAVQDVGRLQVAVHHLKINFLVMKVDLYKMSLFLMHISVSVKGT